MIPRSKLHEFLVAQDVSPLDLQSVFIAFWAADKLAANEIITGEVSPSDEAFDLRLSLPASWRCQGSREMEFCGPI